MPRLSKIGAAALAAFGWTSGSAVSASYLVVAGGAGGGFYGGGGGAGGLLTGTATLNPTLSYTITVGAGGAGAASNAARGSNGSDSVFNAVTSTGGGGGGSDAFSPYTGAAGGSGGGGSYQSSSAGGAGTSGQGFAGGSGIYAAPNYTSGGGGGAGAVGGNGSAGGAGGSGGVGLTSSITGTSTYYAGGGGGDSQINGSVAPGGLGGGGAGARSGVSPVAGTANLGGGGGGGGSSTAAGAKGGSGVVIISYLGAQQFSGGVVTSSGGNTIHTFTTSGTLGPVTPLSANYLVVAGGAGGGGTGGTYGGGGGAGGFRSFTGLVIDPYSTYLVTVGAGGAAGVNGSDSFFSTITSTGGGRGGEVYAASTGGSGGGGSYSFFPTGAAGNTPSTSPSQGNSGGNGFAGVGNPYTGGGGGGAGAAGSTYSGSVGGAGGIGATSSISGTSTYYAGGGGGASGISTGGAGGTGGGGTGSGNGGAINPIAGTANTGGGGGGGGYTAAAGGSGVVIISYAGATQLMAGGVVTIAGGNVIHTFNSSGYLTPLTLLTRSLRFRSSASAYLNRTFSTPTDNKKFTWSGWVKRGTLGAKWLFSATPDAFTTYVNFGFADGSGGSVDYLTFDQYSGGYQVRATTNAIYRDPAAWYHIVVVWDSANATSTERTQIWVNGVRATVTYAFGPVSQNTASVLNATSSVNYLGSLTSTYFDGYMAEINFIDGQALAPTAFGTVNSYGVWQPITYGGSYGTNGFRLPFTNNASTTTLGYDFSPQGNNWTTNNISVTSGVTYDSMTDVPTLTSATAANTATLNPLNSTSGALFDVNLRVFQGSPSAFAPAYSTMAVSSGKWYCEFAFSGLNSGSGYDAFVGIALSTFTPATANYPGGANGSYGYWSTNGQKIVNAVFSAYGAAWVDGDIISIALDLDAGTLTFYKNNVSQGVAATGISGTFYMAASSKGASIYVNFGQQPFVYTAPANHVALNTFNL